MRRLLSHLPVSTETSVRRALFFIEVIEGMIDKRLAVRRNPVIGSPFRRAMQLSSAGSRAESGGSASPELTAALIFKEHGALKFVECWGDDVPDAKLTSFPMAVKRKDDETVVFSWIIWPSRDLRNEA
jgi:Protein of unknown function (DUF1428)